MRNLGSFLSRRGCEGFNVITIVSQKITALTFRSIKRLGVLQASSTGIVRSMLLSVTLVFAVDVAEAKNLYPSFFDQFRLVRDLEVGNLERYLDRYPEQYLAVYQYVQSLPAGLLGEAHQMHLNQYFANRPFPLNQDFARSVETLLDQDHVGEGKGLAVDASDLVEFGVRELIRENVGGDASKPDELRSPGFSEPPVRSSSNTGSWRIRFYKGPVVHYGVTDQLNLEIQPIKSRFVLGYSF